MISKELTALVAHYESLHDGDMRIIGLQPKMCPAGFWTEGYGRVIRDTDGTMLHGKENTANAYKLSVIKTTEQAIVALQEDLEDYSERVDSLHLTLKQNQHDALVSFAYNVGFDALKHSTLLKLVISDASPFFIDKEFRSWNKATVAGRKQVMKGLTARRTSEAYLYIFGENKYFN